MTCKRMGRAPIDSMGFGTTWLTSLIREPRPPQRMMVGIAVLPMPRRRYKLIEQRCGGGANRSAYQRTGQRPRRRVQGAIVPASGAREAGRVAAVMGEQACVPNGATASA